MNSLERILVAVDDSKASVKTVSYLGRMLHGSTDYRVRLFHVVEPIGPSWASVHGDLTTKSGAPASDPAAHLIEEAKRRSRPVLERMQEILTTAGMGRDCIESSWFTASREDSLVDEILRIAREQGHHTVVVGRSALPWYRELFHHHVAERLVKKGDGLSVWVVE